MHIGGRSAEAIAVPFPFHGLRDISTETAGADFGTDLLGQFLG